MKRNALGRIFTLSPAPIGTFPSLSACTAAWNIPGSRRAAKALGYDYCYLSRYAVQLLQGGGQSVSEIAMRAGFSSICSFNEIFKRVTGRTLNEMKKCPNPRCLKTKAARQVDEQPSHVSVLKVQPQGNLAVFGFPSRPEAEALIKMDGDCVVRPAAKHNKIVFAAAFCQLN
jgi:hypothetical protein